jgi:2-amino-4-hydroxy-6-hydroxymethyldihydropteridine diphosphokinase
VTVLRVRAFIALGANVGDARRTLTRAVRALSALPDVRLIAVSRLYRTQPIGVTDQADFLNAAVALDVPGGAPDGTSGAEALLVALKELERAFGRQERRRWGPRELDLDLLAFGNHTVHRAHLDVPHVRAAERLFVLAPWADIAGGFVPPGWHLSVEEQRRALAEASAMDAVTLAGEWNGSGWTDVLAPNA